MTYDPTKSIGARLHAASREALGHTDPIGISNFSRLPPPDQTYWERTAASFVARLSDAPTELADSQGRMRGLADRLDDISERCASAASKADNGQSITDLLSRASVYQECAGLIREALK